MAKDATNNDTQLEGLERLSARELRMFEGLLEGKKYIDAYIDSHPSSKATRSSARNLAYQARKRIIEKLGGEVGYLKYSGLGIEQIAHTITEALDADRIFFVRPPGEDRARTLTVPDHRARMIAAKSLVEIHGMKQETLNVKGNIKVRGNDLWRETANKAMEKRKNGNGNENGNGHGDSATDK